LILILTNSIRKSAGKDSLIFGFGGKKYHERLIYIARVTGKLEGHAYYQKREYARRPDCIYRVEKGRAVRKTSARYHVNSDERKKDVGLHFENAFVLLSDDFRYLGKKGTDDYKQQYSKLRKLIENLRRGNRRYYSDNLRTELLKLKTDIWEGYPRMKVGIPTESNYSLRCNDESPSANC
jgi:hypothetical protein